MADDLRIEIRGGIGPYEAAAVAAVITQTVAERERARARRPPDQRPPAWVRTGMPATRSPFPPAPVPDPGRNWPD